VTDEPELVNEPVMVLDGKDGNRVQLIATTDRDLRKLGEQLDVHSTETQATLVCREMVEAYDEGEANGGSVEWESLDAVHARAAGLVTGE
jgi:hypothetical protein